VHDSLLFIAREFSMERFSTSWKLVLSAFLVALFEVVLGHYFVPQLPGTNSFVEFFAGTVLFLILCALGGLWFAFLKLPNLKPDHILRQLTLKLLERAKLLDPSEERFVYELPLDAYEYNFSNPENVHVYRPFVVRYSFFKTRPRMFNYTDPLRSMLFTVPFFIGFVIFVPCAYLAGIGHYVLSGLTGALAGFFFLLPFVMPFTLEFPWFHSGYLLVTNETIENIQTHKFMSIKNVKKLSAEVAIENDRFFLFSTKRYSVYIISGEAHYKILSVPAHTLLFSEHFDLKETAQNLCDVINEIIEYKERDAAKISSESKNQPHPEASPQREAD
jgi:hypothetical protein